MANEMIMKNEPARLLERSEVLTVYYNEILNDAVRNEIELKALLQRITKMEMDPKFYESSNNDLETARNTVLELEKVIRAQHMKLDFIIEALDEETASDKKSKGGD